MTEPDPIETLLKATGRRPAVDAGRAERVRAAAESTWRHVVAQHARRRRAVWVAALAAAVVMTAVGVALFGFRPAAPVPSGVHVDRVTGVVWGQHGALEPGSELVRGEKLETGPTARIALRAAGGHSVRVDRMTTLRVVSGTSLALDRGAVFVDSETLAANGPGIRIETRFGTVEDRGTRFLVQVAEGEIVVRVREGAVSVEGRGDRITASAGEVVAIDPSGGVERSALSPSDGSMDWVPDLASPMKIEGRTLGEFLDWAVRERGVTLRFADPSLAEKVRRIVLRGSIDGMAFDDAVDSVLATTGLHHRWEPGALVVNSP